MSDSIGMNRSMVEQDWNKWRSMLSDAEAHCLQELAHEGNVLEIGSWTGYSAYRMAFSANRVDCVDPYTDPGGPKAQEFLDNTSMYDTIFLHIGKSADIVPILQPIFDLVFIDGDHTYDGCRLDLELAIEKVKYGGVIALHDYNLPAEYIDRINSVEGVPIVEIRRALDDFLHTHCTFWMRGDVEPTFHPPDINIVETLAWFRVNWR